MLKSFIYIFSLLITLNIYSQNPESKRATHWYFGNGAGLDFSSGSPVADINGALHTYEGCSTISDINGNLLFYTDGDTVWNKNHIPMPNGTGLMGCPSLGSSAQGALIIPQPGNDSLFYVFTNDCWENGGGYGLRYSIVNINLNAGNGDIIFLQKNILLYSPSTEGLTATYNCDRSAIWIMSHEYNNNNYAAYKIDGNGINTTPIISSIGEIYIDYQAYMRFSPNGRLLASAFPFATGSELFEFNQSTGVVFNLIQLPAFSGDYGPCFSPDNTKLYLTLGGADIYQFDVGIYNQSTIINSKTQIDTTDLFILGAISNGIDGKLYVATLGEMSIGTISSPNYSGSSSNLMMQGVLLNSQSQMGLPDFIQNYFNTSTPNNCFDTITTNIFVPNVFTPNNDGTNDFFAIDVQEYIEINYAIYNRWGNEILNSSNKPVTNTTVTLWNGKIDGKNVADGVYYYIINLKTTGSEIKTKKGFIQLLH